CIGSPAFIPETDELWTRTYGEAEQVGALPPPYREAAWPWCGGGAHPRAPGRIGEAIEIALLWRRGEAGVVRVPVQRVEAQDADEVHIRARYRGARAVEEIPVAEAEEPVVPVSDALEDAAAMNDGARADEPVAQERADRLELPIEGEEVRVEHIGHVDVHGAQRHQVDAAPLERLEAALEMVGEPEIVIVGVGDERRRAAAQDAVAVGIAKSARLAESMQVQPRVGEGAHRRFGGGVAAVADDMQREAGIALAQHRLDRIGDRVRPPVGGQDDVDRGVRHGQAKRDRWRRAKCASTAGWSELMKFFSTRQGAKQATHWCACNRR